MGKRINSKYLKDKLTKDFYIKEYFENKKSLLQISKESDISFTNIQRYFSNHNLQVRKNNITKEYLIKKYFDEKLTQKEIANELNINQSVVQRFFKKYNLKGRKNVVGKEHHSYKHGLYSEKTNPKNCVRHRKVIDKNKSCKICNKIKKDMDIHHIDFNHLNNKKENLQILCHSCHSTLHRNYEWQNKRDKNKIKRDSLGRFKRK